jgi:hypothetical protein
MLNIERLLGLNTLELADLPSVGSSLSIWDSNTPIFLDASRRSLRRSGGISWSFTASLNQSMSNPARAFGWILVVQDVEQFRDVLLLRGWQLEHDLHYERIEGAEHNEAAWAKRVGPFLRFLYPVR